MDYNTFMANHGTCLQADCPRLWVFGYGSLLWKPDFEYNSYKVGYIENYERCFNQGNETFRGTKSKPGRVANLEEKDGSRVWGLSYEICGREEVAEVLRKLYVREIASGGYKVTTTAFHPRNCNNSSLIPLPHPRSGLSKSKRHQNFSMKGSSIQSRSISQVSESPESFCQQQLNCSSFLQPEHHFPKKQQNFTVGDKGPGCDHRRHSYDIAANEEVTWEMDAMKTRKASLDFINHMNLHGLAKIYRNISTNFHTTISEERGLSTTTRKCTPLQQLDVNTRTSDRYSEDNSDPTSHESTIEVLLFTVTKENRLYLGANDVDKMATQIVDAAGSAGTNVEYVLRVSEFIKEFIPEDDDRNLFSLDAKIREELLRRGAASAEN